MSVLCHTLHTHDKSCLGSLNNNITVKQHTALPYEPLGNFFPLAAVSHSLSRWPAQLCEITIWQSPPCLNYCTGFIHLIDARQANRPSDFSKQRIKIWQSEQESAELCKKKKKVNRYEIKKCEMSRHPFFSSCYCSGFFIFINPINLTSLSPTFFHNFFSFSIQY